MTPLHQAALTYAARGIPVFPLQPGGKRPLPGSHSFADASTDPGVIDAWWEQADYNIGTEPARSGWTVVDIDDKNGKHGSWVWGDLCRDLGEPAETRIVRTPSGGWHIYFTGTMRPSVGKGEHDGIDIRSEGSYVLLPPSVADGGPYVVVTEASIAPAPAWLAETFARPEHTPALAPENIEVDPEGIEAWAVGVIEVALDRDGIAEVGAALNERTYALACVLKDGPAAGYTVSEDLAVEIVLDHWSSADRVEQAVRNAYRSGENAPGCGPLGDPVRTYGPAGVWSSYAEQQAPPTGQQSRFMGRKPSEAAKRPALTYFDTHRGAKCALPRIPDDGAALVVTGPRSSHKTGVVIKECVDAGVRVLYLAYEGGHGIDTQRLPAIMRQRGIEIEALDDRWMTLSTGPNLMARGDLDELIHVYREWRPAIVVLDTLTRAAVGVDINAPAAGTGIIDGMEYLARGFGGALVIGVHHPGKDTSRGGLGSSLIESLAYAIWRVSEKAGVVWVKVDKMKDGPADFMLPLKVVHTGGVPVIAEIPAEERAHAVKRAAPDPIAVFRLQVLAALGRLRAAGRRTEVRDVAEELAKGADPADGVVAYDSIRRRIERHARGRDDKPRSLTDLFVLDPTGFVLLPLRFKDAE